MIQFNEKTFGMSNAPYCACACLLSVVGFVSQLAAQSPLRIRMLDSEIQCVEPTVRLGHVARVKLTDPSHRKNLERVDLDVFQDGQLQLEITQAQIAIRLVLAGYDPESFAFSGPDQVRVERLDVSQSEGSIEVRLQQQLAEHYGVPVGDLQLALSASAKKVAANVIPDSLELEFNLPTQLPLGRRNLPVRATILNGQYVSLNLSVSLAIVRDLVIAKQNITRGEMMTADKIEAVRRPVSSGNVQYASFDQVLGKPSQFNLQQYDLVKAGSVRPNAIRRDATIQKNALVNVIVRRGALSVVLKAARAVDAGDVGQPIELINPETRERIVATVIDEATAEVRY